MKKENFIFLRQPRIVTTILVPFLFAFFAFIFLGLFKFSNIYLKIILILVTIKILHHIITKGVYRLCFNGQKMEVVHFNRKSSLFNLNDIEFIECKRFSFTDFNDTHVVRFKKDARIKQVVHFYCPTDELDDFRDYLKNNLVKYRKG
jgi:hypothetical protein